MKRNVLLSFTLLLAFVLVLSGCGGNNNESGSGNSKESSGSAAKGETKTIKIFQFKVEIAEALNRLKTDYEASHPGIKLDIQTVGGGSDYGAALKAKFASGEEPDIFNVGGQSDLDTWIDNVEDLSNEKWASDVIDVAKEPLTRDGKLYGQPMNIEGYGFIYNKDLFAKAGITEVPTTLSGLEDAAKKLQAAGITPFVNGYQELWVLGNHLLNVAFAHQQDPAGFVKGLNDGTASIADNEVFSNWVKLFDLTLKYSNKNPLTTDYNTEMAMFAGGEAAITQQGNWTQTMIDGVNPNLNLGIMPMPISDDSKENDTIYVGVPNYWVVNKNSPVKAEAKEFLNWLATTPEGQKYITEDFKFIPAFKNITTTSDVLGDLGSSVLEYSQQGKTLGWYFNNYPDGAFNEFGSQMQAYIAGNTDAAGLLKNLQQTWDNLKAK
ncbi:ABC transporter substrate-binding protein [Paenibacillus protaetiae]|uniref:Carbohydrate ABC transporter substrate-binding protein n=1 Tax=Paenibacillus protaetiae TaxID=2509456 RepID=A0A4V0YFC6_9BACL|nr:ABC transporter substrate-binding protein [Paenibacillus protaetiae]QAY67241.1 carbohydrate ABC transporter substrate-binding protein [Paenibacillus protaetiae]